MCLLWADTENGLMFPPMYLQNSVCEQYSFNLPGDSLCAVLKIHEVLANKMIHNHLSERKANKPTTFGGKKKD